MNIMRASGLVVVVALGGCELPPVAPTSDTAQNVQTSRIEGEAVVAGSARGNLVILRFDATRPPPPLGTGRPEAFTIITREELYKDAAPTSAGPFTAPYAFSLVPPGSYLLRGFLDAEGSQGALCSGGLVAGRISDFNPWYGVTGEPNCGDVGGAAVDALTLAFRTVTIATDEDDRVTEAATGVTFTVQQSTSTTVPADRPAYQVITASQQFAVSTAPPCNPSFPAGPRCKVLDVAAMAVYEGVVDQRAPAFLIRFIDNNNDCVADDINGDNQPDFWPRVFVRKLADTSNPALLVDENDRDRDGVVDTDPGLPSYPHADGSTDTAADAVLLAAGIIPDAAALSALVDGSGQPRCTPSASGPVWPVAPAGSLRLAVQSVALDVANPSAPVRLQGVPPGKYAMTVMQFTGQTWRLPNELQPLVAGGGLPAVPSQAWYLDVQQ